MRKPLLISLVCILGALALLLWGFNQAPAELDAAPSRYVLLIESDTGSFLMQLRKGMQEAAAAHGAYLAVQIVSPDAAAQAAELADAGFTAAILLLDDPAPMLEALKPKGIPALIVGQIVRGQVCIISDDEGAGLQLLQRALSLALPEQVLLLTDAADPRAMGRVAGAIELARHNSVLTLPWVGELPIQPFRVMVGASAHITRQLAEAKAAGALSADCLILGVDTGDSRVQYLERGLVSAFTADNPYAMGYLAAEKARLLTMDQLSPSLFASSAPLIDIQNMYLHENVKLVFPLLQ